MKTKTVRRLRWLHRSLGLLLLVQLLFWVGGGLIMSLLQIDAVRGSDRAASAQSPDLSRDAAQLLALAEVLEPYDGKLTGAELRSLLGEPAWHLRYPDRQLLVDARSGKLLSPISEAQARELAAADLSVPAQIIEARWQETPSTEIRGRELPLWRIQFDDDRDTTIYISATTGAVVARRNCLWRIFDVLWMLHIMDYSERESFNHPLLQISAATALAFVLSGLLMLVVRWRRGMS